MSLLTTLLSSMSLLSVASAVDPKANSSATVLDLDFNRGVEQLTQEHAELVAGAKIDSVGPTKSEFLDQPDKNPALVLDGKGSRLRIADDGQSDQFDFTNGDKITLEAWVRLDRLGKDANVYIVGKGRTHEVKKLDNQNYALRLRGVGSEARVSFLFATPDAGKDSSPYHRWTSDVGFSPDGGWHHVAISYQFGSPESLAGFVDGEKVKGKWDMGGATKEAPIVDNDAIWIGSAMGGNPGNSFAGALDDVRITRDIVPNEVLLSRRKPILKPVEFLSNSAPGRVTFTIHPGLSSHTKFPAIAPEEAFRFHAEYLAIHRLPMRFIRGGIRDPWKGPLLLRAYCTATFDGEEIEWMIRSPGLSRIWIDGEIKLTTPAHKLFPDAHNPFIVYEPDNPWLRVPSIGDNEVRKKIKLSPGPHQIIFEQIVGAKSIRTETGETTVAVRRGDELFTILGTHPHELPLSDEGWSRHHAELEANLSAMDAELRKLATDEDNSFWNHRHEVAREVIAKSTAKSLPAATSSLPESNLIDRFVNNRLAKQSQTDTIVSDEVFMRRAYLDTIGVLPSAAEIEAFLAEKHADKRTLLIARLLQDSRWADNWTSMWQDILAENPSLLKPTLNNTGPFRYFIHDALLENKPADRFVTELIRMEGDKLGGGAAGFAMASENDVPMAAKAHILTGAFLGVEMKCARCHDAPYHPYTQKELFALAAMLENKPIKVPATSSVPKAFFERKKGDSPITLSIFPGDVIEPAWSFDELSSTDGKDDSLVRDASDRERMALLITHPRNERFAQVIVNRLWHRLMGWGLVSNLDDWYRLSPRDPELLSALARNFVENGYDMKHTVALILTSRAYQRPAIDGEKVEGELSLTAPWIRRMTAEQVVDSLHTASGLPLNTEELTFDPAGQQNESSFLNLGVATKAWELIALSNERDRPSLSLPRAGMVVECLEAFGWRGSRQEPSSHRETAANMVQPGVIANGSMTVRLSRFTEDSRFTQLALDADSPTEFVEQVFLQVLTRKPTAEEEQAFLKAIEPGFSNRITTLALPEAKPKIHRGFVDWANHFDTKANMLMRDVEREVAAGPAPTTRLTAAWREQAEDAVWSLMNTPEFQFIQ